MEQQGVPAAPDADITLLNLPLPPPPPMPVDNNSAPLPPPPPMPAEYGSEAGPPPPEDMDMDMEMDAVSGLPPPPPPPPPVEGATAGPAAPAGEAQGGPPLPGPPITLPAPESADPTQQGGEMSEEQYNAMTPEQQAAYWHQWQQYTSQQHQGAAPEQAHLDPNAHYAQDPNYQAYYAQYQYGQPDAQQWTQYAAQPPQQHYGEQPDYSYYHQQQQPQQAHSQPYPPQAILGPTAQSPSSAVDYSTAPGSSAAYTYSTAAAPPAVGYSAGLGMPLELPELAPPKKAVPDWLRAEMLKRGISSNAQAAPKPGSDSDSEPEQKRSRRLAQAGGSRWGGDEEKEGGSRRAASGGSSSSEEDEEKVSRAEELRRERLSAVVKRNLTGILLEVTDGLFDEIAKKALKLDANPEDSGAAAVQPMSKPETTVAAVIVNRSDDSEGSDGSGGDALGLGYGSDDGSGSDGEDGARIEASSPPDQGAVLEVLAPEQRQDSPGLAERQPVDVNEEQTEHKQDDSRAPEVAEAQSLAGSSVMQSGAGASSEAGLLKTDNAVEHGSAQAHAADYAKADGMDGAAEGQVAAPQGNPASLTNGSAPVQALFSKGSSVWYLDRDKKRQAAVVMSVDVMHPPASYCIRLEGADNTRDTEESRLEPRPTQKPPISAHLTPEAMATSLATPDAGALPQQAAGELEHSKLPENSNGKSGVSAGEQPADRKEESKRKHRGTDRDESRKSKSSRRDEKAGKEKDKEKAKEKVKAKSKVKVKEKDMEREKRYESKRDSKDESGRGVSEDRDGRSRGDRYRRQSSRSLSRSHSRERHRRARSQSRDRRRDSDRQRGSRSASPDRRRRRSVSRSPHRRRRDSDSRAKKRSRRGDS